MTGTTTTRPGVAALLSALVPGLGQVRLGARRRGALLALPFVGIIGGGGAAAIADPRGAIDAMLGPGVLGGVLVLVFATAVYHVLVVIDAFRLGSRAAAAREPAASDPSAVEPSTRERPGRMPAPRPRAVVSPLLVLALAGVVSLYGFIELVGVRAYQAASAIFTDPDDGFVIPGSSFSPLPSPSGIPTSAPSGPVTEPPPPSPTPVPVPAWAADGRLNLLLIGSDAGPGRWMARMDSISVLSVEIATGRAAVFTIWRYFANIPLPPESAGAFENGRFPGYLNALWVYAMGHPKQFPGGEAAGFRATAGAVQELIGTPIDGAVAVNLNGFVDLVDAIGGLWIDIPFSVYDPKYALPDGRGYIEVRFDAGCQKLDGERALEYARTRHQDSDWGRMRRQQRVIVALARQLDPIGLLPRVPALFEVARDNLWTTIQPGEIADLAAFAARVDTGDIQTYSFWPPTTPQRLTTAGIEHVREVVRTVFDEPRESPTPKPESTPKPCPRK